MKKLLTIISLFIIAFSGGISYGKDTLTIGTDQEPNLLNPLISQMRVAGFIGNFLFSYFVRYDQDLKLVPDLITQIPTRKNGGISKDGLTYTYHLRKNARWHDGKPLTSGDVKFTYHLIIDSQVNVPYRQGWEKVKQVLTPDASTVIFKLNEPYNNFVGDTFFEEPVLPKHLLQGKLKDFSRLAYQQRPVGSGPYLLKEWKHGSHIELKANEAYYHEVPSIKNIIIKFIPNQDSLLMQLETGQIDAVESLAFSHAKRASVLKGMRLYETPGQGYEQLTFNMKSEPVQDAVIRRAIALSVNREELSENIYHGIWKPAYSPFMENSPFYNPEVEKMLAPDPEEAKKLLSGAGWRDSDKDGIREKEGKELEIEISTAAARTLRVMTEELLQQQLKKVGIRLKIRNYPSSQFFNLRGESGILDQGQFHIALFSWSSALDPSIFENFFSEKYTAPGGQNYSGFKNKRVTQLFEKGALTWEPAQQNKIYHEISRILAEEIPLLPLLRVTQVDVYPSGLQNFKPNPTQIGNSWNCYQWKLVNRHAPAQK